jgi:hypothetical protein
MNTPARIALFAPWLTLCLTLPAAAQCGTTDKETFSNGSNQGGWAWSGAGDAILANGGNPHAYLRRDNLDTFAPQSRTALGVSSIFTGDYASTGVTALGIDLRTFSLDFNTCQRPLSLLLENDNGTPGNVNDDRFVYLVSAEQVPCVDGRWHSYSIDVPSQSAGLPAGWLPDPNSPLSGDQTWQLVIHSVTRVRWFYGDPTNFFIFAMWSVGMDNPRITHGPGQLTYCTSKTNSLGCSPAIESSGLPSASLPAVFDITCAQVRNQKAGLLFYSLAGRAGSPFSGGTLCMAAPIRRTPAQGSGGSPIPANDCTGSFSIDFNAFIQSGIDPALQVTGAVVDVQWWGRDPGFAAPNATTLSNALEFVVCP